MNFSLLVEPILRLALAMILGALVGLEREITHKPAGLRTHMLVSLGSCLFTLVSILDFSIDPARIAAGIVTGIGFIGAGTIIAEQDKIVGITTAASLWMTAAIGLAAGVGDIILSIVATLFVFIILSLKHIQKRLKIQ